MTISKAGVLTASLAIILGGCVTEGSVRNDASEMLAQNRVAPEAPPVRNITSFTPALRCMDNTFMMYGIRDVVVITEDLDDKTKKVAAGTKDMLISAVSEMTKRSRAIKLIAYGNDSGNLISYMKEAENKTMFQMLPQYGIRGSISQLDENVAKKTEGGGLAIDPWFGLGTASTASATVLGLDLTMMRTADLTIIPGVTSSNSVAIMRSGTGVEGEAGYKKFGVNYQMNLSRTDGMSQALRNLVSLATVELFGKLTRTPYWTCLGGTPNDDTVKTEISDWFQSLFAEPGEFVAYWQNQMRIRGLYAGEVNGTPDEALRDAITAYREALGLEPAGKLDLQFFTAYLSANHYEIAPKAQEKLAAYQKASATAVAKSADESPIDLSVLSTKGSNVFRRGEEIFLDVRPSRDAYLYCFMQDENKVFMRFFPNRFVKDPFVPARGVRLPSTNNYRINANRVGAQEHIACFAANHDIFHDLPPAVGGGDFEPLGVRTLAELKTELRKAAGPSLGIADFPVNVR